MLHRQTYCPTETEHDLIKQSILNYPRQPKWKAVNNRDYTIFLLTSSTGLRIDETLKIRLEHINWERRTINIPAENSKNREENFVWINDNLLTIINEYLLNFAPETWLFFNLSNRLKSNSKQSRITKMAFNMNWRRYLTFAGLNEVKFISKGGVKLHKIRFHSASRTYFINNLFRANPERNITELSRITRHKSIQCLYDYYLRFNDLQLWKDCLK